MGHFLKVVAPQHNADMMFCRSAFHNDPLFTDELFQCLADIQLLYLKWIFKNLNPLPSGYNKRMFSVISWMYKITSILELVCSLENSVSNFRLL